jgi:hypothetical protein
MHGLCKVAECLSRLEWRKFKKGWPHMEFDTKESFLDVLQEEKPFKMRRLFLLCLVCALGCQSVRGPLDPRPRVKVDHPCLTIEEQERLNRDRYGLPDNAKVLPPEAGARPGR